MPSGVNTRVILNIYFVMSPSVSPIVNVYFQVIKTFSVYEYLDPVKILEHVLDVW
jgi:hypothetical protein